MPKPKVIVLSDNYQLPLPILLFLINVAKLSDRPHARRSNGESDKQELSDKMTSRV